MKSKEAQRVLAKIMSDESVSNDTMKAVQSFTNSIYGAKSKAAVAMPLNKFRYKVFRKAYSPKANSKNPLDKLKGLDASGISPCESELVCHVRRAAFVAKIWSNADKRIKQRPSEVDGWELVDNSYRIVWHKGDQLPDTLVPDENTEDERSGTDEECQAEFVVSSDDKDPGDDNGDATSEHTDSE